MSRIIPGDTDQFTNITGIGFRNNNNIYHYFYDKLTIRGNGKGYPRELYNMSQLKSLIDDTPGAIIEDKIMNLQRLKKIQISDVDNNNISEKLLEMPNLEKCNIAVKYDKKGCFHFQYRKSESHSRKKLKKFINNSKNIIDYKNKVRRY